MRASSGEPFPHGQRQLVASLFGLAGAAWALTVWQAQAGRDMPMGPALFLATWLAMMVAMMSPSATPMVLTFHRMHAGQGQQRGRSSVSTWAFVAGYLAVWAAFGVPVLGAWILLEETGVMAGGRAVTGGLLILAGVYQLSPLKRTCLTKCRTPVGFLLGSWRNGVSGAFRMGLGHGLYCLGCCWLLFALLLPLGLMNLAAMLALTLLVFAEKALPLGPAFGRAVGIGLAIGGLFLLAS